MQPYEFDNSKLIIENVLQLIKEAIINKAFIVIAQYIGSGTTHIKIINEIYDYPYKAYIWHNKNDKSKPIQNVLHLFTFQMPNKKEASLIFIFFIIINFFYNY